MSQNHLHPAESYERISVIGAGAWGTALAAMAAANGRQVRLWAREPEVVASIAERGINDLYLPNALLPKSIQATADLAEGCDAAREAIACTKTTLNRFVRPGNDDFQQLL